MLKLLQKFKLGIFGVLGVGVALAAPLVVSTSITIQASELSKRDITMNSITPYNPIPYEVKLGDNINDNNSIQFIEGENSLSFKPVRMGWDTETYIEKRQVQSRQRNDNIQAFNIDNREKRNISSVNYLNVFGVGDSIGVLAYKDVFRKITKINSLASLGAIPPTAKFLEIEFEIESTYPLPLGILEDDILLREGILLKTSLAWDNNTEIDIESEIIDRSGQLIFIKRVPVNWLKTAQFPVYADADTSVVGGVDSLLDSKSGLWGPYWINENKASIVYIDDNSDLAYASSTDAGITWSSMVLFTGNVMAASTWFDKETPEDTGNLIHLAWLDSTTDNAFYRFIDISDGTLGTERLVDNLSTVSASQNNSRVAITKTISGNLIYAYLDIVASADAVLRSSTSTESWVSRDTFSGSNSRHHILLYPANTGDDDDATAIFWDAVANELNIVMYDESANLWTETNISGSMVEDSSNRNMDGAIRLSDKHLLLVVHSDADTAGDDLKTWDLTVDSIASPTITAKTNIFTDQEESAEAGIIINQQNDDVYVAYLKGGTRFSTVDVVFHKSTDGMGNWGSESAYSEAAADDIRLVHGGRTIRDDGGRIQWSFYNDDLTEIFVNLVNDIEIAAIVPPAPPAIENKQSIFWFTN